MIRYAGFIVTGVVFFGALWFSLVKGPSDKEQRCVSYCRTLGKMADFKPQQVNGGPRQTIPGAPESCNCR
jgi:endonuclease YncB( thermonuclease family)